MANLCVLALYDQNHPACAYLLKQVANNEVKDVFQTTVPWIVYSGKGNGQPTRLLKTTLKDAGYTVTPYMNVDASSTANVKNSYLNFQLAQYQMDGTFIGYIELTSQLFLCPLGYDGVSDMRRFGTQTTTSCKISLQNLKMGSSSIHLPQTANMFYELYL